MPEYRAPGVYVEEVDRGAKPIEGVGTSTAGFLGQTERGPLNPELITSFADFERTYGGFELYKSGGGLEGTYLAYAVQAFFVNGGTECYVGRVAPKGEDGQRMDTAKTGLPPETDTAGEPTLSVDRLDFGTVLEDEDATRTVDLENPPTGEGGETIPVGSITFEVGDDFTVVDPDPNPDPDADPVPVPSLAAGDTLTITVEANRTDGPRRRSDGLDVSYGGADTLSVDLLADVPMEADTLGTEDLFVEFDTVRFGDDPATADVVIHNLTDANIPAADISIQVENTTEPDVFTAPSAPDSAIEGGSSETVTVTFTPPPSDVSEFEGELQVSNEDEQQFSVGLVGESLSNFTAEALLEVEQEASASFQLSNTDDQEIPANEVDLSVVGADSTSFEVEPITEPISGSGNVDVEVTLAATGSKPRRATLQIRRLTTVGNDIVRLPPIEIALIGNPSGSALNAATVEAIGPGSWGENVAVFVAEGTLSREGNSRFRVTVRYWADAAAASLAKANGGDTENDAVPYADVEENYDNLSASSKSSDYYVNVVNAASNLVRLKAESSAEPARIAAPLWLGGSFDSISKIAVSDYVGESAPERRTGLRAFETVDDIAVAAIPDETNTAIAGNSKPGTGLTGKLVEHCESMKDRFAVLQAPKMADDISTLAPPIDSKYAAYYYPWVEVVNPETNAFELVPPGGHVCGIYARSDTERGVHKAPANEPVRSVSRLQFDITQTEQKSLNPRGVNCIRSFPGRGIRVWGARTMSTDPLWKYVNVRRLFLYIEESIDEATQWVVFEPNNEMLWARVRQSVSNFLTTVWRTGALMGTAPEEAFFVKCDRTTMTQDDIDNGRLIIEIGIAPTKPAEFVIFRISQVASGSEGS